MTRGRQPHGDPSADRAQSEAIGNVLLVAVVIVAAAGAGVVALDLLQVGGPSGELVVETRETAAGVVVEPRAVGQKAEVRVEGTPVATIDQDDVGGEIFVPAAPGERITVVAEADERAVLFAETVNEGESGDFIAYYTFEAGSGSTLVDRSANDNDGTLAGGGGGPTWVSDDDGAALSFDGADDHVVVSSLGTTGTANVTEFTVAAKYRITGGGDEPTEVQQIVEHATPAPGSAFEWFLETPSYDPGTTHEMEYTVGYGEPYETELIAGGLAEDRTHVVVGTYDGDEMRLYVDGTRIGTAPLDRDVKMGELVVGADSDRSRQFLQGRLYELRLYYTGMDDAEVRSLTAALEGTGATNGRLADPGTMSSPGDPGDSPIAAATPLLAPFVAVLGPRSGRRRSATR